MKKIVLALLIPFIFLLTGCESDEEKAKKFDEYETAYRFGIATLVDDGRMLGEVAREDEGNLYETTESAYELAMESFDEMEPITEEQKDRYGLYKEYSITVDDLKLSIEEMQEAEDTTDISIAYFGINDTSKEVEDMYYQTEQ